MDGDESDMAKEILLWILCIIGYIVFGIITGMIVIYIEKKNKNFDPEDEDNVSYIGMAVFWPVTIGLFIIIYPFVKLYDFFMWFGKNINTDDK